MNILKARCNTEEARELINEIVGRCTSYAKQHGCQLGRSRKSLCLSLSLGEWIVLLEFTDNRIDESRLQNLMVCLTPFCSHKDAGWAVFSYKPGHEQMTLNRQVCEDEFLPCIRGLMILDDLSSV